MPDISMCPGTNCPKKESCYRFKAKPSQYLQTYFTEAPYDHETEKCEHYWPDEEPKSHTSPKKKPSSHTGRKKSKI